MGSGRFLLNLLHFCISLPVVSWALCPCLMINLCFVLFRLGVLCYLILSFRFLRWIRRGHGLRSPDVIGQPVGILLDGQYPFGPDFEVDPALVSIYALAGVVGLLVTLVLSASIFVIICLRALRVGLRWLYLLAPCSPAFIFIPFGCCLTPINYLNPDSALDGQMALDCKWTADGLLMDSKWIADRLQMDCTWNANGLQMDCKCRRIANANGLLSDCKWIANGVGSPQSII